VRNVSNYVSYLGPL